MPKIKVGELEYNTEDLSDNGKAQLASLQFLEVQMQKLKNEIAVYQTARIGYVAALKAELEKLGRGDIMIVVGGVIPPQDFDALRQAGAAAIFPPGTPVAESAERLIEELNARLGYAQKPAAE